MSKIRVLRIVSVMNRGGIETQLMRLYRELDKTKYQFDFLITREDKGIFDEEIRNLGGNIYNIPSIKKVGIFRFIKNINKFFQNTNYNIVHCHMNTWSGLFLNIARINNVKVRIAHSHTSGGSLKINGFRSLIEKNFKKIMKQLINFGATDYWSVSIEAGKWLFGKKINSENFRLFPNAKNIEEYKFNNSLRVNYRNKLNENEEKFLIGQIANFSDVKNHRFSIELIEQLVNKYKNIHLYLVGDGKLRKKIEELVIKKNLENHITFLGIREDVSSLINAFDLIILPSKFEGIPNVIIESQLNGVNSLVSKNVSREVDLGINRVQFLSIKSVDEWVQKVLSMDSYERSINYNANILDNYDIQNQVRWLEEFYNDRN